MIINVMQYIAEHYNRSLNPWLHLTQVWNKNQHSSDDIININT